MCFRNPRLASQVVLNSWPSLPAWEIGGGGGCFLLHVGMLP